MVGSWAQRSSSRDASVCACALDMTAVAADRTVPAIAARMRASAPDFCKEGYMIFVTVPTAGPSTYLTQLNITYHAWSLAVTHLLPATAPTLLHQKNALTSDENEMTIENVSNYWQVLLEILRRIILLNLTLVPKTLKLAEMNESRNCALWPWAALTGPHEIFLRGALKEFCLSSFSCSSSLSHPSYLLHVVFELAYVMSFAIHNCGYLCEQPFCQFRLKILCRQLNKQDK